MNSTFTCNREVDFAIRWIADAEDLSDIIFIISHRCSHGQDCLVDPLDLLNPFSGLLLQALAMIRAFKCTGVAYKGINRIQKILNLLPGFLSTLLHFHCLLELGYPVTHYLMHKELLNTPTVTMTLWAIIHTLIGH